MTTYGYRYSPESMVFELPGHDLDAAAAIVERRRSAQAARNTRPTVELVRVDGDRWVPVTAPRPGTVHGIRPHRPRTTAQAEHDRALAMATPVNVDAVLADLATYPRRTGHRRKRR